MEPVIQDTISNLAESTLPDTTHSTSVGPLHGYRLNGQPPGAVEAPATCERGDIRPQPTISLPVGFTSLPGPDGNTIYVPEFLVSTADKEFTVARQRAELQLEKRQGGSQNSTGQNFVILGNRVLVPADPHLTERELLQIDTEVHYLCHTLGISYKDASHRLYISEWEKLKANDSAKKIFMELDKQSSQAIEKFDHKLMALSTDLSADQLHMVE
ncbi:hypothetical protein CVT25_010614 [Psilocybe cyanescens]|uniref:Uncharacterized protein n=1 Tax=Psilocybe cyanescens TaxID=93625 RepID=A0A409XV79_PSICY|nr:hypothetical protein CVT25_010614 [Psilocybe cyanescens]